jgi:hypothetical protein
MNKFNEIVEGILGSKVNWEDTHDTKDNNKTISVEPPLPADLLKIEFKYKQYSDAKKELIKLLGANKIVEVSWPSFEDRPLGLHIPPDVWKKNKSKILKISSKYKGFLYTPKQFK